MAQKPRICMVGPFLGRHPAWVPAQSELLAEHLSDDGYSVLITSRKINPFFRLFDTLLSILSWRNKFDVAIVTVFSGRAFLICDAASLLLKTLKKPMIMILRGGNLPRFARRFPNLTRRVLKRANILVSPSDYLADFSSSFLGFPSVKINNFVKIEDYDFRLRSNIKPRILWMRTFYRSYGPAVAIKILESLRKEYPNASLTMAGQDKGLLKSIKAIAKKRGLLDHVSFPGFLDTEGKKGAFSSHDIFLNTSNIDNMPVSMIEAAASGLPVVSTDAGGIPCIWRDGETALLVKNGDAENMTDAVLRLLSNPALSEKLSMNGRKLAEGFLWPKIRTNWENLLMEAMK